MPRINADRLMTDLSRLRAIGAVGTGVVRPAFSAEDMTARRWLQDRFTEAGLETVIDGVGNVFGRSPRSGPALLVGSHSDTQPRGGWLDGALGVIYALEIVRALAEDASTADYAIDAVSWQDEESYFLGCLGSRSWCGVLDAEEERAAHGGDGESLADALVRTGLAGVPRLAREPGRHVGYLEAHIEQGLVLEEAGEQLGVVTSIVGIRGLELTFTGENNHAGTTTMARRRDAATALFEVAHRINTLFPERAGPHTVWTIGNVSLEPGAASIIPGRATLILQFRDPDDGVLDRLENTVAELCDEIAARGRIGTAMQRTRSPVRPSLMDTDLQDHIAAAAQTVAPGRWRRMPSAAGHDPMVIHHCLPCGMLFIPSIGGISHDFTEDSHTEDIVAGCQALATASASVLAAARARGPDDHTTSIRSTRDG